MTALAHVSAREHHKVFSHFRPFRGEIPAHYAIDFLGTKIQGAFIKGLPTSPQTTVTEGFYPVFDEEYFEWIDVLESVVEARDSYTMIELGAGFGRWAVRAALAVEQFNPQLPYRLVPVEAEPVVFEWMGEHFKDNGIDVGKHWLINAAVCNEGPDVLFYVGGPAGSSFDCPPNEWYGRSLTKDYDRSSQSVGDGNYKGFQVVRHSSGWRSIRVPSISLTEILKGVDRVDLIDMDLEGHERQLVLSSIDALDAKVKRMHIGTHGPDIESDLRRTLSSHGWKCRIDYPVSSASETPWGLIRFGNGVQTWVNPRL